jgi:hypothetical protein
VSSDPVRVLAHAKASEADGFRHRRHHLPVLVFAEIPFGAAASVLDAISSVVGSPDQFQMTTRRRS